MGKIKMQLTNCDVNCKLKQHCKVCAAPGEHARNCSELFMCCCCNAEKVIDCARLMPLHKVRTLINNCYTNVIKLLQQFLPKEPNEFENLVFYYYLTELDKIARLAGLPDAVFNRCWFSTRNALYAMGFLDKQQCIEHENWLQMQQELNA